MESHKIHVPNHQPDRYVYIYILSDSIPSPHSAVESAQCPTPFVAAVSGPHRPQHLPPADVHGGTTIGGSYWPYHWVYDGMYVNK